MIEPIDVGAIVRGAIQGYSNQILTRVDDHHVHLSVMDAPYFWHLHPNSDEMFLVIEGTLAVDFVHESVTLHVGQILTVPAGLRHRTRPVGARSVNLTFERAQAATVPCEPPSNATPG
jgi:mannose-6-phosphate isomerase-like protein (cupin superfamily)